MTEHDPNNPVTAATEKMREAGQSEAAIRHFASALERVQGGAATLIPSSELEPVPDVPLFDELPPVDAAAVLERLAIIKLNGGLATSMGLQQPKSLLEARDGRTFLQVIIGQTLALRRRYGVRLPLILMGNEATRDPTLAALDPQIATPELAPDFLQSMVPKLDAETMLPARWPAAPASKVSTRPRRRVRLAVRVGDARGADGPGFPVRNDLQLGQPRRGCRRADRRTHGARADPVPDGGRARHRG